MVPHDIYSLSVSLHFSVRGYIPTAVAPPHRSPQSATQHQTAYSSRSPPHQRLLRTSRLNRRSLAYSSLPLAVRCNGSCGFGSRRGRVRSWSERRLAGRTWHSRYGSLSRRFFRRMRFRGGWRSRAFRRRGVRHGRWRSGNELVRGIRIEGKKEGSRVRLWLLSRV